MPVVLPTTKKVGSTWVFRLTRKDPAGTPIDLTGRTVRAMFREGGVDGPVIATLTAGHGIVVSALDGLTTLTLPPTQTALFTPSLKVFFDVEMTAADDAWQSPTYLFKTEAEVTRDA